MTTPNADRRTALMLAAVGPLINATDGSWYDGNLTHFFRPDDVQILIDCGFLECIEPGGGVWPSTWRISDTGQERLAELRPEEQP